MTFIPCDLSELWIESFSRNLPFGEGTVISWVLLEAKSMVSLQGDHMKGFIALQKKLPSKVWNAACWSRDGSKTIDQIISKGITMSNYICPMNLPFIYSNNALVQFRAQKHNTPTWALFSMPLQNLCIQQTTTLHSILTLQPLSNFLWSTESVRPWKYSTAPTFALDWSVIAMMELPFSAARLRLRIVYLDML